MLLRLALATMLILLTSAPSAAVEPVLLKESAGVPANEYGSPCALSANTNGTAANYRWYNSCSGYIWIYSPWVAGEGVGVLYGGPGNAAIDCNNDVKRVITYFRNVVFNYQQTVDVFVDVSSASGCLGANIASDLNLDPGLRWNCSEFNADIPSGVNYVVVRTQHDGGAAPTFATDGPFANTCDPNPPQRSYYYGINGSACVPWPGQTDAADNWLQWLILDTSEPCLCCDTVGACCFSDGSCLIVYESQCTAYQGRWMGIGVGCWACVTGTSSQSWGRIKGLFR